VSDFSIHIRDTGERFRCNAQRSVLAAMESLGRKGIPVGCRNGGCGVCKVRILSGTVRCRAMSRAHVSPEEEAEGIALACRSYPEGDLEVAVLGKMVRAFGNVK
jgi:ferredoxin